MSTSPGVTYRPDAFITFRALEAGMLVATSAILPCWIATSLTALSPAFCVDNVAALYYKVISCRAKASAGRTASTTTADLMPSIFNTEATMHPNQRFSANCTHKRLDCTSTCIAWHCRRTFATGPAQPCTNWPVIECNGRNPEVFQCYWREWHLHPPDLAPLYSQVPGKKGLQTSVFRLRVQVRHPGQKFVGRAVTTQSLPLRPDGPSAGSRDGVHFKVAIWLWRR